VDDLKDEEIKIDNTLGRMVSRLSDPKAMKKMSPVQDIGSSKTRNFQSHQMSGKTPKLGSLFRFSRW